MAHYLVTGGAGFIGSHLSKNSSAAATASASPTASSPASASNLDHIPARSSSSRATSPTWRSRSARSEGCDYVLHQAAIPSVPRSVKDPITSNRANVDATLNVLVAARDAGVKRLVFAGSSSAYGNTPTLPKREDMPTDPLSPYALQKVVGEQYLQMFTRLYGLETVTHPLLQRLRPAPGSVVAVLGRDLAVRDRAARRAARRRSTATASRRATSPTSPTSSTACCARARRRRASGEVINVATGGTHLAQRAVHARCATSSAASIEPTYLPRPRRATCRTRRPTSARRRRCSATSRSCRSRKDSPHDRLVPDRSNRRDSIDSWSCSCQLAASIFRAPVSE